MPNRQYYKGEIPEKLTPKDVLKCSPCTKCNEGYYLKEGCSGNTNSICESEKVPHQIFLRAHGRDKVLHDLINPHQHPVLKKRKGLIIHLKCLL